MPGSRDIILHTYHKFASPFSEKVRLVLGLKGLSWYAVECSIAPPRPELDPLTGGYRRIPILQVGADIYCDSRCIVRELERRFPTPTVYPQREEGLCEALTCWSNGPMMMNVFGLYFGAETDSVDQDYLDDRVTATEGLVNIAQMQEAVPYFLDQIRTHLSWIERQLGDGRAYLLGDKVGAADFTAYQHAWWLRHTYSKAEPFLVPFAGVRAWMERVARVGHGKRTDISAREALDVGIASHPVATRAEDPGDPSGRRVGDRVLVMPDDYLKVPVAGEILSLSVDEVVIARSDPIAGDIAVHFPRAGFVIVPQA